MPVPYPPPHVGAYTRTVTKCNQVVARSHYSANAKEPHVHCRLRFRTVLLKTAAFTCPPKPVRDKVPFVTRSLVTSTMHDWVVWCKSKKGAEEIRSFELSGKEISSNYDETKSKEEKNKKNRSKKKAHRGQSVQYRSWWKQGNIEMAMSEDHASCWVHKDFTVTIKQIQALLTAARASGGKDECQVRLTGIEQEYWMGTEIGR